MSVPGTPDLVDALRHLFEDRPWVRDFDAKGLSLVLAFRQYLQTPPADHLVEEALEILEWEEVA